jgi:hypothetical protein
VRDNTCRVEGGRGARPTGSRPFPVPAHQTGRAHFEHPAFRQTSPRAHAGLSSCFAFVYSFLRSFRILNGVSRLIVNHLSVAPSGSMSEVRPLPSPGITRLPRYCGPLRHPRRPGLSLASCQLTAPRAITAGVSRVASSPLCLHAVANTPAGPMGLFARPLPLTFGFPRINGGSAPALKFSRPAQRSLALQPAYSPSRLKRPSTPEASVASLPPPLLRLLPGGANQFPGGTSPLWTSAFSRRTLIPYLNGSGAILVQPSRVRGSYRKETKAVDRMSGEFPRRA